MGAYMYAITIYYGKKEIHESRSQRIEGNLSLAILEPLVGSNEFAITSADDWMDTEYIVSWCEPRMETDEEQNARIKKEEHYMEEYMKRHPLNKA